MKKKQLNTVEEAKQNGEKKRGKSLFMRKSFQKGELILYRTEDDQVEIQLRASGGTVWLTQREISELFNTSRDNVSLHLKNIYAEGELIEKATTEESSVVQNKGGRSIQRVLKLYNLDAILPVRYRVKSPRGIQFRRWATTILKEYLIKGNMGRKKRKLHSLEYTEKEI